MLDPLLRSIAIPLLAGFVCLVLPKRWQRGRAWLTVATSAATLMAVCPLFAETRQAELLDGRLLLRVDPLSGLCLLAAAVFALLVAVYSLDYMKGKEGQRLYDACLLWSLAFSGGVFLAGDLVLLVTCWGLMAVTLYLMIGVAGPDASAAAQDLHDHWRVRCPAVARCRAAVCASRFDAHGRRRCQSRLTSGLHCISMFHSRCIREGWCRPVTGLATGLR